ncbi:MAG: OmpA family protein [Paludibacteraceae bacterium]|nr:OmpA family protein [Paludibacteraceae bacterium]
MKKYIYFVIAAFLLSLAMPVIATTTSATATAMAAAPSDKDKAKAKAKAQAQKEKEKAKKEKEKAKKEKEKAKKEKEKAKQQADKQKQAEKKRLEADKKRADAEKARNKQAEARQKELDKKEAEKQRIADERKREIEKREAAEQARDEAILRRWERSQKEQPKHLFNLSLRAGYAALMDKINPTADGTLWGAGTVNQNNALQQLVGGPGVGLRLGYELEYKKFRFETGIDFDYFNSASKYGFQATRKDLTYGATYNYLFDNMREVRNAGYVGIPLMFGAQFNRFYFLVGPKVSYGFTLGKYTQSGQYDITVNDPALLEPYGMGIYDLPKSDNTQAPIKLKQPDVRICAEIGLDLDEWLHRDADPKDKKRKKVKEGERQPFGREYIHYKLGLFAEYGVLNTNATPATNPIEFAANNTLVQKTNTMLAMNGDTKLNTLFVGARFAIQFQVPGREPEMPSSYADIRIIDDKTGLPINNAVVNISDVQTEKTVVRNKKLAKGTISQKSKFGSYSVLASADNYKNNSAIYTIDSIGHMPVDIRLIPKPIFRVTVSDRESGLPLMANVQIRKRGTEENRYTLATDSANGSSSQMLADTVSYSIHIEQFGYEPFDGLITDLGDSMHIAMTPIKQEVFILKNMFFATNKTRILPTSEEELNGLYQYLERHPEIRIKIVGHTDSVGKDEANQKLSEGRANAVMKELIKRGIDPSRLEAEGRGETEPIDTNDTEEGRQNNRRVEIHIL